MEMHGSMTMTTPGSNGWSLSHPVLFGSWMFRPTGWPAFRYPYLSIPYFFSTPKDARWASSELDPGRMVAMAAFCASSTISYRGPRRYKRRGPVLAPTFDDD